MMLGGVICGYCASGRFRRATKPASVMTIESTDAKIGRSMKKCENIRYCQNDSSFRGRCMLPARETMHLCRYSLSQFPEPTDPQFCAAASLSAGFFAALFAVSTVVFVRGF